MHKIEGLSEAIEKAKEHVGFVREHAENAQEFVDKYKELSDDVKQAIDHIDDFHRATSKIQMTGASRGCVSAVITGAEAAGDTIDHFISSTPGRRKSKNTSPRSAAEKADKQADIESMR